MRATRVTAACVTRTSKIDVDTCAGACLFHRELSEALPIFTQYDMIVIDEISMLDAPTFDLLEEVARILRQAGAVPGWLSSVRKRQLNSTRNND